jgi:hypothetical protein
MIRHNDKANFCKMRIITKKPQEKRKEGRISIFMLFIFGCFVYKKKLYPSLIVSNTIYKKN